MKPVLILGLGNPMMSDDGVGVRAAEMLAADAAVTRYADVIAAGSDLLRHMDQFVGRRRAILIDAADGAGDPGEISVVEDVPGGQRPESAHTLSAPDALDLMRRVMPSLEATRFTWVLVTIRSAEARPELSREIAAALPRVVEAVRNTIRGS
jgi:hydrogenase maturation protease